MELMRDAAGLARIAKGLDGRSMSSTLGAITVQEQEHIR